MSSISAGTTSSTALVATADTTGALVLQTNNGTTALTLSTAQNATFAGTLTTAAKGIAAASLPAGSVLQVLQSIKTDAQSSNSTSYVDITGLSVTITPKSATNKILVMANINNLSDAGSYGVFINLLRGSTTLTASTAGGNAQTLAAWASGGAGDTRINASGSIDYLDSPATTSATTYKMQMVSSNAASTGWVNTWAVNRDLAACSSITVMEIAA
jgi:hypothetical protein